ncbi:MAG: hypothetical protein ABI836_08130 [Gemmatimonadota bacterium]
MSWMGRRRSTTGALLGALAFLAGCGGGDGGGGGGGPNGGPVVAKAAANSGDHQNGTVAQLLADSFRVVVSQDGSAKAGVTVNWSSAALGAVLSPGSSVTDAQGQAAIRMTAGTRSGGQGASATLSGGSTVNFAVTIAAGPPANLTISSGDNQAALVNTAVQFPLKVQVTDQFINTVVGAPIAWSLVTGSGSVAASTLTDAGGLAATTLTVGGSAETLVIRAVSTANDTVLFTAHSVTVVKEVLIKNDFFQSVSNGTAAPSVDTISVGESVQWTWQSGPSGEHNVIPQGSPLFQGISGRIKAPFIFGPVFFGAPGTYHYDCNLHAGMSGIIVVE